MADDRHAHFNVPNGTASDPLNFTGLTAGNAYRMTFTATGNLTANFVFRPGGSDSANDTVISTEGAYDITFTVAAGPGAARFLHTDVTGVSRVDLTNINIWQDLSGE